MIEITLQQIYGILSIFFLVVFPLVWEKGIRPQILPTLEKSTLLESERIRNRFLSQFYNRHFTIIVILLGIGVLFGILAILQ